MLSLMSKDAPREIRAAVLAMKKADKDIRRDVATRTRNTMNPVWRAEIARRVTRPQDAMVLAKGARIAAGNPPTFVAGSGTRRQGSGGGLVPTRDWPGQEYGSGPKVVTYTRKSPNGGTHSVTRNTTAGYPARTKTGRILGPAARDVLPRTASYWVQSVIRAFMDAAETGRD